jgi:hypothetical protein
MKLVPIKIAMISPGPLFGKEVGVGVVLGAVVPAVFFVLLEDGLGEVLLLGVGLGGGVVYEDGGGVLAMLGVLLAGLGVVVLFPWLMLCGETVVGAGPELFETL